MSGMMTADFANFDPRNFYSGSQIELSTEELKLGGNGATTFRAELDRLVERLQAPPPTSATFSGRRVSSFPEAGSSACQRAGNGNGVVGGRHRPPSAIHDADEDHDLGVFHQAGITSFDNSESPRSAHSAKALGRTDGIKQATNAVANVPISPEQIRMGMCEEQMNKALNVLSLYLAKMPRGALVFEIGSRCGEVITALSRRFPGLWMQPTEGTGRTSHSLHILLEEHIKQFGRELDEKGIRAGHVEDGSGGRMLGAAGRVLKPRFFDAGKLEDWLVETHSHVSPSLVFAVNVLHFMPWKCVETIIEGCSRTLRSGAVVFLAGPFFNSGSISQDNLLFHAALGDFAQALRDRGEQHVCWGLHDVQRILECAEAHGLEIESKSQFGDEDREWFAIVLRKPGSSKTVVTGGSSKQRRHLPATGKHVPHVALAP